MEQVYYEIKAVSLVSKTSAAGKQYQVAHVEYRDDYDKLQERDIMPFGPQKKAFDALNNGIIGKATISRTKNDKGFWEWHDVQPNTGETVRETVNTFTASKPTSAPRNTYETPEERALRQKYIVRQSSITNSIALFELDKKRIPTVQDIIATAKVFEDFVFGKNNTDAMDALVAMDDDVPL